MGINTDLIPEPMGTCVEKVWFWSQNPWEINSFFGLCAFTRSLEGLKLCQNVARVSPGGVKGLDLGLGERFVDGKW